MKIADYEQKSISIKALVRLINQELTEFKTELSVGDDIKSHVHSGVDKRLVNRLVADFDDLFSQFSDLYSLCLKIKHSAERTLEEEKWKQVLQTKKKSQPATPQTVEEYIASLSPEVKAQMKARVMAVYGTSSEPELKEDAISENPVENPSTDPKS